MPSSRDPAKKRKRDIIPEDEDEKLEIDVNAPEPPSKKAKRKEKKASKSKSKSSKKEANTDDSEDGGVKIITEKADDEDKPKPAAAPVPAKRSDYGIWIGNLPFAANKDTIRKFLLAEGGIGEADITRLHMPTAEKGANKGFAYVDFTTPAILESALALSECNVQGRSVLIKNSKSYEGRPEKTAEQKAGGNVSTKEPNKRIFVGNLSFDVSKDELAEHFGQAGKVSNVHMATFEDSGKCKGYAWVTFAELEAAKDAVRGFIYKEPEDGDDSESEEDAAEDAKKKKKKSKDKKPRKWFINRIHARELKIEFAEDPQTRYKKRYGSGGNKDGQERGERGQAAAGAGESVESIALEAAAALQSSGFKRRDPKMKSLSKDERQDVRRKRHDARMIAPGRALANKQRASEAIVAGTGSKKTFD